MAGDVLREMIGRLRRAKDPGGFSDAQLLARYTAYRDEAAFELLVWRHGGLVLGAARRLLGNCSDADDAFQAAFLTLARKAGSIRRGDALAPWLHQVVARIARRERKRRARRRLVEQPLNGFDPGREAAPPDDLAPLLDVEVARLPERYRRVVVLCYLQGKSVSDAAVALGCPRGTVLSRLAAAREMLKKRLLRRGIAPALVAGMTAEAVSAPPSTTLVAAAVRLAGPSAEVPNSILQMSNGVIHAMFWKKCRTLIALVLIVGVCGVGLGAGGQDKPAPGPGQAPSAKPRDEARAPTGEDREAARQQLHDELQDADKLLEGAEAKLASERSTLRARVITVEEKLRELEYRQAWAREQQRRTLQNLEIAQRDRQAQQRALETKLRDRQIEIDQAAREVQRYKELREKNAIANPDLDKVVAHYDGLRRAAENESAQVKNLIAEFERGQRELERATKESLAGEEQRTAERVELRQELAVIEEHAQGLERKSARQRDRLAADVEALVAKLRQTNGAPAPPRGPDVRDLQRQLEALQRELNDLRREQKRTTKPE